MQNIIVARITNTKGLLFSKKILLNPAFTVIVGLLLAISLCAQPTIEDYGSLPTISRMLVSPNGEAIAFRKNTGKNDIVVILSRKQNKVLGRLDISKIRPSDMYFIDENRLVILVTEEKIIREYKGLRHDISTAYVFDVQNNKLRQLLTPGDNIYKGQLGLGKIVALDKTREYAFMPAYVGRSKNDQSPDFSLMKVKLESPRNPRAVHRGSPHTIDYFVGPENKILAREDYSNRSNTHSILAQQNKKWLPIYKKITPIPEIAILGLTPNRKNLVVLGEDDKTGRTAYYRMSLGDGKLSDTDIGRTDADIDHTYMDINRVVYGVRYSGFTPSYKFFDEAVDQRIKNIVADFPEHSVHLANWSENWEHLVVYVAGSNSSGLYFLYSAGKEKAQFLSSAYPGIESDHVHPLGNVSFKARDGRVIPTLITIPRTQVNDMKNLPAVLMPHGGPETYDQIGFDWLAQALANEGYLVIQPQFRGSSGFGAEHRDAGHGEWGKKMQDDVSDAVAFFSDKGIINPGKVCIVGASYGGYSALAGGAYTPSLYKCVVSINGVSDIPAMLASEKSEHGKHHWVLSYWAKVMAAGKTDKNILNSISPANFAKDFQSPVLLLHGEKDKVVPFKQSQIMQRALKKSGKKVTLIKLKGENHHLQNRETRLDTLKQVQKFLGEHLK